MNTFVINTDNDRPLKTQHVAFFAERKGEHGEQITLHEVVRNTYKHPDAINDLTIDVLEIITLFSERNNTPKAATIELVDLADKNAQSIASNFYSR